MIGHYEKNNSIKIIMRNTSQKPINLFLMGSTLPFQVNVPRGGGQLLTQSSKTLAVQKITGVSQKKKPDGEGQHFFFKKMVL